MEGCINCGANTQGQCRACVLVDGDETFKMVTYCETCNAYLCKECKNDTAKRAIAATKQAVKNVAKRVKKIVKKLAN